MVPTFVVILTLAVLYWFPIRRWMSRWGTTPSDLTRVMAGDSLLVDPTYSARWPSSSTRRRKTSGRGWCRSAISVAGSTATTGSTDCSAIWIVRVPLAFSRSFSTSPSVTKFPSGEARAGRLPSSNPVARSCWICGTWAALIGCGSLASTRLTRNEHDSCRAAASAHRPVWARLFTYVIEPAGFLMTRRMLLGIKHRAEGLASARAGDPRSHRSAAA